MPETAFLLLPLVFAAGWYGSRLFRSRKPRVPRLSDEYFRGLNFLLNEQPDKAIQVFIDMMDVNADTVETHLVLGNLFRKRGEVDRAIRVHQNLIARPALDAEQKSNALLELAKDYMTAGLLDRAEGLFQELIDHGHQIEEACSLLQRVYEQEREWPAAIVIAEHKSRQRRPELKSMVAHYYCEMAEDALRHNEQRTARAYIRKAYVHDSFNPRAMVLDGNQSMLSEEYKAAIKAFTQVVELAPNWFPLVADKMQEAYERMGREKEWLSFLKKHLDESNDIYLHLAYMTTLLKQGHIEQARMLLDARVLNEAITLDELDLYLQYQSLSHRGDVEEMVRHLRQWVRARLNAEAGYQCDHCGYQARAMAWQCPSCHHWGSIKPRNLKEEAQAFDAKPMAVPDGMYE